MSGFIYGRSDFIKADWIVGFYKPNGDHVTESCHSTREAAVERVRYLNGGAPATQALRMSTRVEFPNPPGGTYSLDLPITNERLTEPKADVPGFLEALRREVRGLRSELLG